MLHQIFRGFYRFQIKATQIYNYDYRIPSYIEKRRQKVLEKYKVDEKVFRKLIFNGYSEKKILKILGIPKSPMYTFMKEFYQTNKITIAREIEYQRNNMKRW